MYFVGAFCDLVWSDPEEIDTWKVSPRGAGWLFGSTVTHEFMSINNLNLICRAHQLVHEGKTFALLQLETCMLTVEILSRVQIHVR